MVPHIQTILHDHPTIRGNCWQTVIACILEKEIEEIPHFVDIDDKGGKNWFHHTIEFLNNIGWDLYQYSEYPDYDGYVLVSGKSPRGNFHHVVIYKNGKLFHDPHPSGEGIETEEAWEVIFPKNG